MEALTGLHLTPHDLRRSFAAIANYAGGPDITISMLMNHKKTDITGRYVGRDRYSVELALLTIEQAIGKMIEDPVESMFEVYDRSIEARLGKIREAQDRARKRR